MPDDGTMQAWELDEVEAARVASGQRYEEFFSEPDLSGGLYVLDAGATDLQSPHGEDELYYVVSGRAHVTVGGATREIFTPAACECVHLASRGVPRLVNQICDYALVYAFTDGLDKVDASVIEQVVTDRRAHGNLKMMA